MALIQGSFYSETIGMDTGFMAILPEKEAAKRMEKGKLPTLYLLHGGARDYTSIVRDTNIVAIVEECFPELAVIMPNGDFSFYTDYQKDYRYAFQYKSYICKELVEISRSLFPLSDSREDTAIFGWSMGGFGAMTAGLNNPSQYGCIGAQCGMVDIDWAIKTREFLKMKHARMFGDALQTQNTSYDFYALTQQLASQSVKPRIFHCWTTEDYLKGINEQFNSHCLNLDLDYTWKIVNGDHGWGERDAGLRAFICWLADDYYGRRKH